MKHLRQPVLRSLVTTLFVGALCAACGGDSGSGATTDAGSRVDVDPSMTEDTGATGEDTGAGDTGAADTGAPDSASSDTAVAPDVEEDTGPVEPLDLTERLAPGQVRAGIVDDVDALIGGPKADGRLGDIKLYNDRVAFIIEGARRASGGYRYWGGNIVDGDVIRPDGEPGQDIFGEVGHSWNLRIFQPEAVTLLDNGANGGPARVRITGRDAAFDWADSFIRDFLNPSEVELEVVYEYSLAPNASALEQTITVTNVASVDARVDLPLKLSNHGDGLRQWLVGSGFEFSGGTAASLDLASRDLSYTLLPTEGRLDLLFEYSNVTLLGEAPFVLAPGESATRTYRFGLTDQGSSGLARLVAELRDDQTERAAATVSGAVEVPEGSVGADPYVVATSEGDPVASAPVMPDGSFVLHLPAGTHEVTAWGRGHAPSASESVTVASGESVEAVSLALPEPAEVAVSVVNSAMQPEPARVTLIAIGEETPSPHAPGMVSVESSGMWRWTSDSRGGRISAVGYAIDGSTEVTVPAGEYRVWASRGFAYTLAETTVVVEPGERASLELTIDKVVDTSGWLSSDFHIHALRSPDSDVPLWNRVQQAITDELDIPVITEHVSLTPMEQLARDMEVTDRVVPVDGQEVTTFAYGHFNAFPLVWQPVEYNAGAVFPYDKQPAELFAAIREQQPDDEIIQVNHPRGTGFGAYFSYVGFDRETGDVEFPEAWDLNWDTIEVFNGNCGRGEPLSDWIAMTNLGLRKVLASGSDSHRENDPIGIPRNWIQVDRGALSSDRQSIVEPVRGRRLFVSCGPFVRFESEARDASIGDMISPDEDGEVAFWVQVQAPDWIQLDEVRLWRNGEAIESAPITSQDSGVRFEAVLRDRPEADAWYAVEVLGSGSLRPVYYSSPYALTNPIEVDVNGDGEWTPPGLR